MAVKPRSWSQVEHLQRIQQAPVGNSKRLIQGHILVTDALSKTFQDVIGADNLKFAVGGTPDESKGVGL